MKKVLLSTSGLALASAFASPAASAEWDVRVGGYMEQHAAWASSDVDNTAVGENSGNFDGIDSKQDSEIHFLPPITMDNGMKIGANSQLEGFTSGDTVDESYMFIKGSFGQALLGSENSAGYKMTYAAPDVTFINVNSGSMTAFMPISGTAQGFGRGSDIFRGTLGSAFLENARNNDAQRFTYFTPRFSGFQAGVSYARDGRQDDNTQVDIKEELHDIFDVGVNYVNSFGSFDVAVSGHWGTASDDEGSDPSVWATGLNLGFSGVTVGGSYGEQNGAGVMNGWIYDAGVSYETGPWGFSFTYIHGKNRDNEVGGGGNGSMETLDQYLLGMTYKLAVGVKLQAFGAYVDFDESNSDDGSGQSGGDDVDGWVIGTGIKINW